MMKHLLLASSTVALLCAPRLSAQAQPGPDNPMPTEEPAPPPPVPPPVPARAAPAPARATGQWAYTQQYGWIWMPYGSQYEQVPATQTSDDVYPQEYVYMPFYGWTWLDAPWIWGWGPSLYFSVGGVGHFSWYHPHAVAARGGVGVRGQIGGGHISGGHLGGRVGGHGGGRR